MTSVLDSWPADDETVLTERLQEAASRTSQSLSQEEVDRLLGIPEQPTSH